MYYRIFVIGVFIFLEDKRITFEDLNVNDFYNIYYFSSVELSKQNAEKICRDFLVLKIYQIEKNLDIKTDLILNLENISLHIINEINKIRIAIIPENLYKESILNYILTKSFPESNIYTIRNYVAAYYKEIFLISLMICVIFSIKYKFPNVNISAKQKIIDLIS